MYNSAGKDDNSWRCNGVENVRGFSPCIISKFSFFLPHTPQALLESDDRSSCSALVALKCFSTTCTTLGCPTRWSITSKSSFVRASPSLSISPAVSSRSWPGVRIVITGSAPAKRISNASSMANASSLIVIPWVSKVRISKCISPYSCMFIATSIVNPLP